ELPGTLAEAWRRAQTPPSGPVFLELPVDLLAEETDAPADVGPEHAAPPPFPAEDVLDQAADLLRQAERPLVWAGGGVLRSGAWEELAALARRLGAAVATTYMGKGAFPEDDPLSLGSACDERAFQDTIAAADILLCVGTELGAETTAQYRVAPAGKL